MLIERIKQLVRRDRVDIDRFLITTFTNAAAAEMKEKMQRAIHQELDRIMEKGSSEGTSQCLGNDRPEDSAAAQRQR